MHPPLSFFWHSLSQTIEGNQKNESGQGSFQMLRVFVLVLCYQSVQRSGRVVSRFRLILETCQRKRHEMNNLRDTAQEHELRDRRVIGDLAWARMTQSAR